MPKNTELKNGSQTTEVSTTTQRNDSLVEFKIWHLEVLGAVTSVLIYLAFRYGLNRARQQERKRYDEGLSHVDARLREGLSSMDVKIQDGLLRVDTKIRDVVSRVSQQIQESTNEIQKTRMESKSHYWAPLIPGKTVVMTESGYRTELKIELEHRAIAERTFV